MAEKRFDTRILLKYDSLANWNSSSLVLKAGEVAIATVPTTETITKQNGVITPPAAVIFKVGDGEHSFKDLPIVSALAADVYGWAKKSENEFITWLDKDAGFATDSELAAIKAALDAKDKALEDLIAAIEGGGEGSGSAGGLTAVYSRLSDLESILVSFLPEGDKTADAVKLAIDAVAGRVSTLESKVATLESGATAMNAEISGLKAAVGTVDESKPSLAEQITAVDNKIGEVVEGKTIIGMISEAQQAAKDYTDEKVGAINTSIAGINSNIAGLDGRVEAVEGAIEVLNGTGEGSVNKKVADAIAAVVAEAPEDFNTLKEIADYIASDKTNAAEINNTLSSHAGDIAGLKAADVTINSNISGLQEQINAIVGDGETTGTLVALEGRVKANEDAIAALQAEDTRLAGLISGNSAAIEALGTEDTRLAGLITNNSNAITAEQERAEGVEATLLQSINDEAARADAAEKANKALIDAVKVKVEALHTVASSGLINDLAQKEGEDLIFDCGNATGYSV